MSVTPSDPGKIERLRQVCLALPGVTEKLSHGEPSWFVGGKQFVTTADHHHDDRLSAWLAAPEGAQQMLVQGALKGAPALIVTAGRQNGCEVVVTNIQRMDALSYTATPGMEAFLSPGLYGVHR